jgi:pyridoxamine 5'-phosphate oxidase
MVLSTCAQNQPSQRVVYLREVKDHQLVFYTNYQSRKGSEIDQNSLASILFFWAQAERQIRLEGKLEKAPAAISDQYFQGRPRNSQLGAWASEQSKVIESRQTLEERLNFFEEKFKDQEIPRPPFWGGYLFKPVYFEFWQGRPSRLHDRISYKSEENNWKKYRLAP